MKNLFILAFAILLFSCSKDEYDTPVYPKFEPVPVVIDTTFVHNTVWEAAVHVPVTSNKVYQYYLINFYDSNKCDVIATLAPGYSTLSDTVIKTGSYKLVDKNLISSDNKDTLIIVTSISKDNNRFILSKKNVKNYGYMFYLK